MKTINTTAMMLIFVLLCSACGIKKSQTRKHFRLTATAQTINHSELKPISLVIKRPKALSILGGRPMVATQADGSLVQLSHNFWLESPKVLLQDRFKQWAENHWQSVSYQTPTEGNHQILDSRILAFEKNQLQAKVSIEFLLYDADHHLIFNQQFTATENMQGEGFRAFALAISQALDSILEQLHKQLNDDN